MNKKCTLLAAAFMVASAFTASAADNVVTAGDVTSVDWTAGNYYFLQTSSTNYLALSGEKADSVIVKTDADFGATPSKAALDSALWQIASVPGETAGNVYQFKNKKTNAILSFAASPTAQPVLANGVNKWVFTQNGTISANNGGNVMTLGVDNNNKLVFDASSANFKVVAPEKAMALKVNDLGDGFSVFQLSFGGDYDVNIFKDKDLVATLVAHSTDATSSANPAYLQAKGEESYSNGVPKYFGVDTLKTTITGAEGAYGDMFSLDSIRTVVGKDNADFKKFWFTIDLKNDSLAMYVKSAPGVKDKNASVRVVYASLGANKTLTVSEFNTATPAPNQGVAPFITVAKGTPSTITTGSGVYFLKSASNGGQYAGKYILDAAASYQIGATSVDAPSVYLSDGQWYIKEDGGKYSIVDRKSNTSLLDKGEIFAVKGMANTYTFGASADSITVVHQSTVSLANKYLGSLHFSDAEMANNGYALNLLSATGVNNLYVVTSDSVLQAKTSTVADAIAFKLMADTTIEVGGAKSLGDTLYQSSYMLKERFSLDSVAYFAAKTGLKLSAADTALVFVFNTAATGGKYSIAAHGAANALYNVSADAASSNLTLAAGSNVAYFNFVSVAAPEYASIADGHKVFMSDGKSLAMNPLNFWAEMKNEGQPIVKADYAMDDFAFWVAKAASSTVAKPLYWISKIDPASAVKDATAPRYYMVSFADSTDAKYKSEGKARVGFVSRDTITTMANSPALFALKTMEDGYWLENQRDLAKPTAAPFVSVVNNVVVMSNVGAPFSVESTTGPVSNEEVNAAEIIVTASVGTISIRNAAGKRVALSNILGQSVGTYQATSDYFTVPASRGVVIVVIEGETAHKVLVK